MTHIPKSGGHNIPLIQNTFQECMPHNKLKLKAGGGTEVKLARRMDVCTWIDPHACNMFREPICNVLNKHRGD